MTAVLGVSAWEEDGRRNFLHRQVSDVSQRSSTCGAAVQLGLAVLAYQVATGALGNCVNQYFSDILHDDSIPIIFSRKCDVINISEYVL